MHAAGRSDGGRHLLQLGEHAGFIRPNKCKMHGRLAGSFRGDDLRKGLQEEMGAFLFRKAAEEEKKFRFRRDAHCFTKAAAFGQDGRAIDAIAPQYDFLFGNSAGDEFGLFLFGRGDDRACPGEHFAP